MTPYNTSSLTDSYIISLDISAIQEEARVRGYLLPEVPADYETIMLDVTPAEYVTMTGLLEAVSNGPQTHRDVWMGGRVWPLVCIALGLALMGFALVWFTVILPLAAS